jgi:hypothetical protein
MDLSATKSISGLINQFSICQPGILSSRFILPEPLDVHMPETLEKFTLNDDALEAVTEMREWVADHASWVQGERGMDKVENKDELSSSKLKDALGNQVPQTDGTVVM